MTLTPFDWALVVAYFLFSFGIAIYYTKRAGQNTSEFFLSGRDMPWWLAGTSLVATTFAADTPLAVTELVAKNGIAGNWLWWNAVAGLVLTVFFFARLWRRAGILTDVEFVELRYDGKAAAALRGLKAVYFGLFINVIIIGWVNLAMEKVMSVLFPSLTLFGHASFNIAGFEFSAHLLLVALLTLMVAVYSLLSGLWGVSVTDVFQFAIAMVGCFVLAWFVLDDPRVGGIAGLKAQLPADTFRLFPKIGAQTAGQTATQVGVLALTVPAFIAYIGVQWWASWYPGSEPGGGGYAAQRMMSAKDERHSMFAALWFAVAHICLRPWPWIITALGSLVLFPNLAEADKGKGFVMAITETLPSGLVGLLFAAFLAAFMSTIATQLNWGVSYLVNDFWRRFVKPKSTEKELVFTSRWMTFVLAVVSVFVTSKLGTISGAWALVLTASAGLGLVLILRWYWWRLNAWSELVATVFPLLLLAVSGWFHFDLSGPAGMLVSQMQANLSPKDFAEINLAAVPLSDLLTKTFPINLFAITALNIAAWLTATFLTRPTSAATLDRFYRRVRPGGNGWKPVAARNPDIRPTDNLTALFVDWIAGIALVYGILLAVGEWLFGSFATGVGYAAAAAVAGWWLWRSLAKVQGGTVGEDEASAAPDVGPVHDFVP